MLSFDASAFRKSLKLSQQAVRNALETGNVTYISAPILKSHGFNTKVINYKNLKEKQPEKSTGTM